ncbi:hypothetical protein ACVSLT_14370 [Pseudomonas aeruginosa]|nr:hypothetical protein [Pseudomonas aeruginosa]
MITNNSKAPSCTCPSGDGSLVHPCPAHPASVKQAGGDERAAFEAWATHLPMDRQYLRPDLYMPPTQWAWDAWQARAALAQPSPAPELVVRGTQHRFSTTEQTCRHDFAGVWWNDNGETKTGRECRHCGFFVADVIKAQAEQAEAERPNQPERYTADVFHPNRPYYMAQTTVVRASDFDAFAAQYERIVGALRTKADQLREALEWRKENQAGQRELLRSVTAERDAAQAEIERLDRAAASQGGSHDA